MSKRPGKNKENLQETKDNFLKVAREEFSKYGYSEASTSRIVQKSGMARGSLYYHFGDKNGLFKAVYKQIMHESYEIIAQKMDKHDNNWDALKTAISEFLDLCMHPTYRKIILMESQSAMTYKERYEVHAETLMGKMKSLIPSLIKDGYFSGHTIETVSILIFGMLAEAGRTLDGAENISELRQIYSKGFESTLKAMEPNKTPA